MITSLPMYNVPFLKGPNARFWALIRDRLRSMGMQAPDILTEVGGDLFQHWEAADLILSQTCGFPYRTRLHDKVKLVGTLNYALEGCPPGYYKSLVVVREDDPRETLESLQGARFAYNDALSQSGWASVANIFPSILENPCRESGAHFASAQMVVENKADFAAIDAITWRFWKQQGNLPALKIIYETNPTPGLPLITALENADDVYECVSAAIKDLTQIDQDALGLQGIFRIPTADYLAIPTPPSPKYEPKSSSNAVSATKPDKESCNG